jgi:hypothetical protein
VLALGVGAYVDDFNARVIGAYEGGTGSQELPADVGGARSLIPPGTAALRDFLAQDAKMAAVGPAVPGKMD